MRPVRLIPLAPAEENRVEGDTLSFDTPHRVVNIAGGEPVRLMDFIRVVERALGRKAELNMMDIQPGEMPQTFGDATLLRALTGYVPETELDAGVTAFVEWYERHYG